MARLTAHCFSQAKRALVGLHADAKMGDIPRTNSATLWTALSVLRLFLLTAECSVSETSSHFCLRMLQVPCLTR